MAQASGSDTVNKVHIAVAHAGSDRMPGHFLDTSWPSCPVDEIEARLSRVFLKLARDIGQPRPEGTFVPVVLSRQDIANMIGTTIETSIRLYEPLGEGAATSRRSGTDLSCWIRPCSKASPSE